MGDVPVLLPAAQRDVEEIHEYTSSEWGPGQARRYIAGLQKAISHLVAFPQSGKVFDPVDAIRIWHYESHRILYREHPSRLEVVRIIHAARDIDRVLLDE